MARERKRPMSLADAIGRAVTRKARPTPTDTAQRVRALEDAVGRRETARRLEVSDRTLRRWRAGGQPSRAHAAKLAEETLREREVRRQAVSPRRETRLRNRGAYVRMSGKVGGGSPGAKRKNTRQRTIGAEGFESIHLSGDDMSEILDRWEAGNDEGALEALREAIRETPWGSDFGSFEFDDLTRLEFLRDDPNG